MKQFFHKRTAIIMAAFMFIFLVLAAPQAWAAYSVKQVFSRFSCNAGETLTTGQVVCIKDSDGEAYKADANVSYLRPAVGIVGSKTGGDGTAVEIITRGTLTGWSSLAEGNGAYLSETAGAVTQSAPEWRQNIGVAVNTTSYRFDFADSTDRAVTREYFRENPITAGIAGGAATGTAGDENVMIMGRYGPVFEYHIIGTQTILAPSLSATGLDVDLDDTENDGAEFGQGITARSPAAFTVGTDAFYLIVQFYMADVSGADECAVGFRNDGAYQAAIDDYTDMAALNVISGAIYIETIDDDASTTSTDTTDTWGDTETHTLAVYVDAAGAVTYQIDGAAPSTTAAHTIDSGDVLVPFFYYLNDAHVCETITLISWECGPQ